MNRFRKKPVIVEAHQWDGGKSCAEFIVSWIKETGHDAQFISVPDLTHTINIRTLEGEMMAMPHDWVIKGVQGEFYPCKPDIFEATYEEVEEPSGELD